MTGRKKRKQAYRDIGCKNFKKKPPAVNRPKTACDRRLSKADGLAAAVLVVPVLGLVVVPVLSLVLFLIGRTVVLLPVVVLVIVRRAVVLLIVSHFSHPAFNYSMGRGKAFYS